MRAIAYAIGAKAQEEGLDPASEPVASRKKVKDSQWFPEYMPYEL